MPWDFQSVKKLSGFSDKCLQSSVRIIPGDKFHTCRLRSFSARYTHREKAFWRECISASNFLIARYGEQTKVSVPNFVSYLD